MKRNKLLRISEIIITCMFAILPSSNPLPMHNNYCKTDSDCHEANFYCYESRECVECTKCSFYNRHNNPAIKCAKNKDECGDCSSGMEAELNFDGTFTCNPVVNSSNNNQNPINNEPNNNFFYFCIPVFILALILCIYLTIKCKLCLYIKRFFPANNCSIIRLQNDIINNNPPPPPYSEKSPEASAPPEEDPLIARTRILSEDNQRANPFHHPNYVNGGTYSNDPFEPVNHPDDTPDTPDQDENTQPSPWSPNTTNDLSNEPTSFSNILSISSSEQPTTTTTASTNQSNNHENNSENRESSGRNQPLFIQVNISNNNMNNTQVINEI